MGALRTKVFWADAFERAVSTAAQAVLLVSGLSEDAIGVINQEIDMTLLVYAGVGGFILTVLKAIAASNLNNANSASLLD